MARRPISTTESFWRGQDMLYSRPNYTYFTSGVLDQVVYSSMGGAKRTMVKEILAKIDAEIARLEQAKALLSATGAASAKRKPGRPAKVAVLATPKVQKTRKRGKMSAEGRERIRQAQIKRWAALKGVSKANLNATVAPLPKVKKKATKAA
jgi:hypothetical protein